MHLTFSELEPYMLSPKLWGKLAPPIGRGMQCFGTASGNPAIGFFDDFFEFATTSGAGGYVLIQTGSGTTAQIASTGNASTGRSTTTHMGCLRLLTTAADNDEAIIGYGNVLDAPFKLANHTLCFECRMKMSDLTTSSHGFFIGLATLSAQVTVQCITASDAIYANAGFLGFQQLKAETTAVDGMFQESGGTNYDGSDSITSGLDTLATLVAGTYVKLGFRFNPQNGGSVQWFVDGVEDTAARTSVPTIEANESGAFPDASYMSPIACLMNDGTTACNLDIDWWACAQYL